MLSSHRTTTRVVSWVQIYTFILILTHFFDKVHINTMKINVIKS